MGVAEPLQTISQTVDPDIPEYDERGSEVAHSFFTFSVEMELAVIVPLAEATDQELLPLFDKSGAFDFWKNPEEDIYTLEDNNPA